jgi:hypothetical protein
LGELRLFWKQGKLEMYYSVENAWHASISVEVEVEMTGNLGQ